MSKVWDELVCIGLDNLADQMRNVAIFGHSAIPIVLHLNPGHRNIETLPNGNALRYLQLSGIHKSPHKRSDPSAVTDYENLVGCVSSGKVRQILKNGGVPPFDRPTRKQLRLLDGRIF